mmetsp:Transcript_14563/g.45867  ORF Transcript_14563/g.45867 Transcript_14563/m.45867 type:complete len:246 (-) Transcript_14563:495-1232(-)
MLVTTVCTLARMASTLAFLRSLTSPSGQAWQRRQSSPFRHPCGFQNQAQGWHSPVPWNADPRESNSAAAGCSVCSPGGPCAFSSVASSGSAAIAHAATVPMHSNTVSKCCGATLPLLPANVSVRASPRKSVTFAFLRTLSSSAGQAWQWRHSWPFRQPMGFQNHAQGLHIPEPCIAEPMDSNSGSAGICGGCAHVGFGNKGSKWMGVGATVEATRPAGSTGGLPTGNGLPVQGTAAEGGSVASIE